MSFVIVGGGPTGVEMAGSIAELARVNLARDFRRLDPKSARLCLVEASDRILTALSPNLSNYALRALEKLGVETVLGKSVTEITEKGVQLDAQFIPSATAIWAAGTKGLGAGKWLGVETDAVGRIAVMPDLSVPSYPDIFVIWDTARVDWMKDTPVPGIAPAAKQQGRFVADVIKSRLLKTDQRHTFQYRHAGNLATIGRNSVQAASTALQS